MTDEKPTLILLVEDNNDLREIMRASLALEGHEVVEAANGKEAKELFDQRPFDLVISDVRMPQMSGIELLRHVQATNPCPFILITGHTEMIEAEKAIQLGASTFMAKPFNTDTFLTEVRLTLRWNQKTEASCRTSSHP